MFHTTTAVRPGGTVRLPAAAGWSSSRLRCSRFWRSASLWLPVRSPPTEAGTPAPTEVLTVGSGDTLWAIAADLAADGDVRAMINQIEG